MEQDPYQTERNRMVDWQIERRGIFDSLVLSAMGKVPRHRFLPPERKDDAYNDYPCPIGYGQTISQPYIVGLMTSLLELHGGEKILEIGTGSGYQAAILAQIAGQVISIEMVPQLAERARATLYDLDISNVQIILQDGSGGYPLESPYGGILVTACAPRLPDPLIDQLASGARLVIPVEDNYGQVLQIWEKDADGEVTFTNHIPVTFVPLHGKWGR